MLNFMILKIIVKDLGSKTFRPLVVPFFRKLRQCVIDIYNDASHPMLFSKISL